MRFPLAPLLVLLTLGSSFAHANPPGEQPVRYRMKVAGKGADVRIRRVFRPGLPALQAGALMTSPALVAQDNYDNIKTYSKLILGQFPPDQYYYVGVGRTAGPIIAMLKNLGPDLAVNFPSSEINTDGAAAFRNFTANYTEHIEALVPASVRGGDRKLLLIDYSSGSSLYGLKGVLEAYRATGRPMPDIEVLSVGYGGSVQNGVHKIDHDVNGSASFWKEREQVAEFIGETSDKGHVIHSAGGALSVLKRNPKFTEHRKKLYERMRRDQDLDDFLRATFPQLLRR